MLDKLPLALASGTGLKKPSGFSRIPEEINKIIIALA